LGLCLILRERARSSGIDRVWDVKGGLMADMRSTEPGDREEPLSRTDWVLLPLIAVSTVIGIACATQWLAGRLFTESSTTTFPCLIVDDPSTGVRAIPRSHCSEKIYESALVSYSFNSCGHRAGFECGPKPPDTYRIVMVGSSFNLGMRVPRAESFAALLPKELSRRTGRNVELYNEAMQWGFPRSVDLRIAQAIPESPDMIFWPLTPEDIEEVDYLLPPDPLRRGSSRGLAQIWAKVRAKSPPEMVRAAWTWISSQLDQTRSVFMLKHFLFMSQSQFIRQTLASGASGGYLRVPMDSEWTNNLDSFERHYEDVQMRAQEIGAVVVVTLLPARVQAAMISINDRTPGSDPYLLDRMLRTVVTRHGGRFVDILPDFRNVRDAGQMYFPVDGHPDTRWHALVAKMLSKALLVGEIPHLREIHGTAKMNASR